MIDISKPREPVGAGFTIVELLVVIVVIGILAAMAIVSYNGIQDRAYASKAKTAARSYVAGFRMYKIDNGGYPSTEDILVCLGESDSYPADGYIPSGNCTYDSTSSSLSYTVNPAINSDLATYIVPLPNVDFGSIKIKIPGVVDLGYRGITYASDGNSATLNYYLKGDQDCGLADATKDEDLPVQLSERLTVCTVTLN